VWCIVCWNKHIDRKQELEGISEGLQGNVALFGGSFNPPHIGHTLAISYVLSQYSIDTVLVVPTFKHAFAKNLAPYKHRMKMVQLAMNSIPQATISGIEGELEESRTLNTVRELYKRYPDIKLRLVVGSDILDERDKWMGWKEIEKLAPPIILPRAGYYEMEHFVGGFELPLISSSNIRHFIKDGKEEVCTSTVAPGVMEYIKAHELYK
jgi:nicotinate-nucleotide adenylyltransferase